MSTFLRVSEAVSLAFHAMLILATRKEEPVSARQMASTLDASKAHLAVVLQRLAKEGLVRSTRGPKGGFTLGRPPSEITLLEIYEVIDGSLTPSCCLLSAPICDFGQCIFGRILPDAAKRLRRHFSGTTLSKLTKTKLRKHSRVSV